MKELTSFMASFNFAKLISLASFSKVSSSNLIIPILPLHSSIITISGQTVCIVYKEKNKIKHISAQTDINKTKGWEKASFLWSNFKIKFLSIALQIYPVCCIFLTFPHFFPYLFFSFSSSCFILFLLFLPIFPPLFSPSLSTSIQTMELLVKPLHSFMCFFHLS